jgi:hypothetical protein
MIWIFIWSVRLQLGMMFSCHCFPSSVFSGYHERRHQMSDKNLDTTYQDILSLASTLSSRPSSQSPSDFRRTLANNSRRTSCSQNQASSWISSDLNSINNASKSCSISSQIQLDESVGSKQSQSDTPSLSRSESLRRRCKTELLAEQNEPCQLSLVLDLLPWVASVVWIVTIWFGGAANPIY